MAISGLTKRCPRPEGHTEELNLDQVRVLARNGVNETQSIMRDLTATARRRLGARLDLHERLLDLLAQMANVADGDHALMVELVERRAEVVEQLERTMPGAAPRPSATIWTLH